MQAQLDAENAETVRGPTPRAAMRPAALRLPLLRPLAYASTPSQERLTLELARVRERQACAQAQTLTHERTIAALRAKAAAEPPLAE